MDEKNPLIDRCARGEFYSYGTIKIFERRVRRMGIKLKAISFLGLLSPLLAGGLVMAFSSENEILNKVVFPALSAAVIAQSILSLLSLCFKWEENYSYAKNAIKYNTRIYNKFSRLRTESHEKILEKIKYYEEEFDSQEAEDTAQAITEKEKRFAMRHALMYFGKPCQSCSEVPSSLKANSCDMCGNF